LDDLNLYYHTRYFASPSRISC